MLFRSVSNPAGFNANLCSAFTSQRALEIPNLIASACPVIPPPKTFTVTSYCSTVSVSAKGWFNLYTNTSVVKYSLASLPLILMFPEPGL